jgi:heptaprenyl diphosphate synthase
MAEANNIRFEDVDKRVQQYIDHPLLRAHQVRPTASRFHFDVLSAILQSASVPRPQAESILEAVLLLQLGLSIHDQVERRRERARQLVVLTGDYSSGQYYWILARVGDRRLLSELCEAVVRINEAKMTLWQWSEAEVERRRLETQQYIDLLSVIHGELLFAVCAYFFPHDDEWMAQVRSLVQAYVVNRELKDTDLPNVFTVRQLYDWLSDTIERLLHGPINARLQQTTNFLVEYLQPLKRRLENQALAEGNR